MITSALILFVCVVAHGEAQVRVTTMKICPVGYDTIDGSPGELICSVGTGGPSALQGCHSSCPANLDGIPYKCCGTGNCFAKDPFCRTPGNVQSCGGVIECCPNDGQHQQCNANLCAPPGYRCCGLNNVCRSDEECCGGQCFPAGHSVCCEDSTGPYACASPLACGGDGTCCPSGFEKGCSDPVWGVTCHNNNGGDCSCCGDQCCFGNYALCCRGVQSHECGYGRGGCSPWFGNQTVCGPFCQPPVVKPNGARGVRSVPHPAMPPAPANWFLTQSSIPCNARPDSLVQNFGNALQCFSDMSSCPGLFGPNNDLNYNYLQLFNNLTHLFQPAGVRALHSFQKCVAKNIQAVFAGESLLPICSSLRQYWHASSNAVVRNCWSSKTDPSGFCNLATFYSSQSAFVTLFEQMQPPLDANSFFTDICLNPSLSLPKAIRA